MAKTEKNKNVKVVKSNRKANIAVIVVVSIAVLFLIAIAVVSFVHVDPMRDVATPERYALYNHNESNPLGAGEDGPQSEIRSALGNMDFTVMTAILNGHWDYSYNFKRNSSDNKIEVSASDLRTMTASENEYMVEFIYDEIQVVDGALDYSNAQVIKVDGENVYFDRIKVLIGDTGGKVGLISMYPYIFARLNNQSDIEGISSKTYKVTGINVRAETSGAYAALQALAESLA